MEEKRTETSLSEVGESGSTQPRQQILFIQLLRGIAPLLVVWAHLSGYWLYEAQRHWVVQDLWVKYIAVPFHIYQDAGHLGVIIFFLISGYIISLASARETRRAFAVKRAFRILPALALALVLSFVAIRISLAVGGGTLPGLSADAGVLDYFKSLLILDHFLGSVSALGPTWTLAIEVTFYASMLAILPLTQRSPGVATWYLILGYATIMVAVLTIPAISHVGWRLVYLPFLFIGRVAYLWGRRLINGGQAASLAGASSLLFVLFYVSYLPGLMTQGPFEPVVTYVAAPIIFLGLMSARITRIPALFQFLGDISYSVYVLHIPVGMLTIDLLLAGGTPFSVAFAIAFIAVLVAAVASYRWLEIPMQRLARTLTGPRREPLVGVASAGGIGEAEVMLEPSRRRGRRDV